MPRTNFPYPEEPVQRASRRTRVASAAHQPGMKEAISVEVSLHCDGWLDACPEAAALARTAARAALPRAAGTPVGAPLILGLILTDDDEQRRLNRTYRGRD